MFPKECGLLATFLDLFKTLYDSGCFSKWMLCIEFLAFLMIFFSSFQHLHCIFATTPKKRFNTNALVNGPNSTNVMLKLMANVRCSPKIGHKQTSLFFASMPMFVRHTERIGFE